MTEKVSDVPRREDVADWKLKSGAVDRVVIDGAEHAVKQDAYGGEPYFVPVKEPNEDDD